MRQWRQVQIGDRLLRFMVEILTVLATLGLGGFLEHPQYPVWRHQGDAPRIWMLQAIRLLRTLECISILSFDQCVCGSDAKKPTTLMLLRLPRVRQRILALGDMGRCCHPKGAHTPLIGRQQDGSFHTARAKIYPRGLNLVLAEELYKFAMEFNPDDKEETLPDIYKHLVDQECQGYDMVQPDFHG